MLARHGGVLMADRSGAGSARNDDRIRRAERGDVVFDQGQRFLAVPVLICIWPQQV
jgi:hypothetical protein